ncbi:MAG TPA: diacylglycerol kinase family protein [Thermoanaerobaculia bacterium]
MNRGILFLNPRSGTSEQTDQEALRALAVEHGLRVVEIVPGVDVGALVRQSLEARATAIVVAGGDGSVHHVAQSLVNTEGVLGIVPAGTINHLAHDLGLPVGDWRAAFEIAVGGEITQIDVGRAGTVYFLNSVMLGMYPTISEYRERFRSMHSRWRAYLKATRLALRQFPHVTLVLELDGRVETLRTQMFVVSTNAYDLSQPGLISPKTSFHEGRLAIYSLSFMSRLQFIRAAAKYLRGRLTDVPGFRSIRTTQIRVDTGKRRLRVALDGEIIDVATPLDIVSVPSSLLVRTPREPSIAPV